MNLLKNSSDSELAHCIKNSEKYAYQELYERYAPRIYHFSLLYLKNKVDAEELVQDVFLKIWEKRETLDTSKNIKSFIFKIAVNTIYDFIRRKNIENAFKDFALLNYKVDENFTWHKVIYEDMLANLDKLVAQMPEQRQKIYRLNKEEGLSAEEIAEKLNLSKRTVENQLYRALVFLKGNFQDKSIFALLFFYLYLS